MKRKLAAVIAGMLMIGFVINPTTALADSQDNIYYDGMSQKKDSGYDEDKEMKDSDVHYGWDLGRFCIKGYTRKQTTEDGNPLFIKNVGDTISLSFILDQDINALNGKENVFISEDTNGYDNYFGISKDEKTNFGKGTLLVKYTDYQNNTTNVAPYVDYLNGVAQGAETEVQFFDEGDYEIALDYEIRKNNIDFWVVNTAPSYSNYQILIKFSVRNGNCMVYPFDVKTKAELVNSSFTENGFYLDLARSRYLTIDVKKMNYVESEGTLIEDVRFNKPASDGEAFTDEGVYIITVRNPYTKSETEKKIYVGKDPILKAYVTTGKDIEYIKQMLSEGATIEDDGRITLQTNEIIEDDTDEVEIEKEPEETTVVEDTERAEVEKTGVRKGDYTVMLIIAICVVVIVAIVLKRRKTNATATENDKGQTEVTIAEKTEPREKVDVIDEEAVEDEGGDEE